MSPPLPLFPGQFDFPPESGEVARQCSLKLPGQWWENHGPEVFPDAVPNWVPVVSGAHELQRLKGYWVLLPQHRELTEQVPSAPQIPNSRARLCHEGVLVVEVDRFCGPTASRILRMTFFFLIDH